MPRIPTWSSILRTITKSEPKIYLNSHFSYSSNVFIRKRFLSDSSSSKTTESAPDRSESTEPANASIVYTEGDKTLEAPLKILPHEITSFDKAGLQKAIVVSLKKNFKNYERPTPIQQKMSALLQSNFSIDVVSPPGCGKSSALALYLASSSRIGSVESITSLLLVPSAELALEYYKLFDQIFDPCHISKHELYQVLYRTGDDLAAADEQKSLLIDYPAPYILIATPTRVLDFLSSSDRSLLPMNNLACIAVDEVEGAEVKPGRKQSPLISLVSYIRSFRNAYIRNHEKVFEPLRYIVCSSDTKFSHRLTGLWTEDRPMAQVSDSKIPANQQMNTELVMFNYNQGRIGPLEITGSVSQKSKSYYPIIKTDRDETIKSFAEIIAKLHKNERAIVVLCNSLSATFLTAELQDNHKILTAFPYGVNYAYMKSEHSTPQKIDIPGFLSRPEEEFGPSLLITRPGSIRGVSMPNLKRVYLLWHEGEKKAFRQLSRLEIAYATAGEDKRTIFSITTPTSKSDNESIQDTELSSMLADLKLPRGKIEDYL